MSIRRTALETLTEITDKGAYANLTLKEALRGLEERGETGERRGGDLPRELRVRVLELRGGEKDAVVLAENGLDVVRLVEEEDVVAVVQRRKDEVADVRVQDVLVVQRHDIRLAQ